jgi:hypothetical protein
MKIKIKRLELIDGIPIIQESKGTLYEYEGYQLCICLFDNCWFAIELSTGFSMYRVDRNYVFTDEETIKKLKKKIHTKTGKQIQPAIEKTALPKIKKFGLRLPINERIKK